MSLAHMPAAASVVVVGAGPVGSSIARSLAARGFAVTLIGPTGELLCSSNDLGRIARAADAEGSLVWAARNKAAISLYPQLQQRSGVEFYKQCGSVCIGTPAFLEPIVAGLEAVKAKYTLLPDAAERFPYLRIPKGSRAVLEAEAGYVNPAEMIRCNKQLLLQMGSRVIEGTVTNIAVDGMHAECTVDGEQVVTSTHVIVACGGLTQHILSRVEGIPVGVHCQISNY